MIRILLFKAAIKTPSVVFDRAIHLYREPYRDSDESTVT